MAEGAFTNLLLCAILSIIFGLFSGEIFMWPTYVSIILEKSGYFVGGLFLLLMGSARGLAFLFQWLIVRNTSATFSQVMTNARRLIVIIILIVVLGEPYNIYTFWAILFMIAGMNLYVVGSYAQEKRDKLEKAKKGPTESTPLLTTEALRLHDSKLNQRSEEKKGYKSTATLVALGD